jgi:hypothetical protein
LFGHIRPRQHAAVPASLRMRYVTEFHDQSLILQLVFPPTSNSWLPFFSQEVQD